MTGKIGFVSLGCPKALVDSERILTRLKLDGYETTGSYADADVVVVNTCGFIDSAIEESLDAIREAMDENGRVIVTGCLGARRDLIASEFQNRVTITGPQAYDEVVAAVHEAVPTPAHDPFTALVPDHGVKLTPGHYGYLKISEGCNHRCTFCVIPQLRGKLRSRLAGDVLEEAERLAAGGVREILVISQDTSAYGADLRYRSGVFHGRSVASRLPDLARELGALVPWVRLHYVYPYPNVDALMPLMADGLLLPYLDVPLQHAAPRVLRAMRRPAAADATLERIRRWREQVEDLTLRSTFIVGFPGETEAEFEALLTFLEAARIDRVGCFTYSDVDGAAANDLPDPVPESVKQERFDALMSLQARISSERLAAKVGAVMEVLVDSVDDDRAVARSKGDAPEIDGLVYVDGAPEARPGDLITVRITASDAYDLFAVPGR